MFNWVCPRCGRENSPSYTECPDCKDRDLKAQAEAAQVPPPVPVEQQYQNPPQIQEWQAPYQPPQQPIYNPPQQQPQYVQEPPQYAPQQHYGQPPQQYAPPQYGQPPVQQPGPQYPPQQPQYAQPPYNPTQQGYVHQPIQQPVQQAPQQYAPPQYAPPVQQYAPVAPVQATPVPPTKPQAAYVPPSTPLPAEEPAAGLGAKISALPTPVLMLLFAMIFLAVGAGIYFGYQRFVKGGPESTVVQPTASSKPKATNPIQKYIEVVGIRLTTDAKKKPVAKFIIVNHASTDLNGLGAIVTLWASTSRSEEDAIGSFTFNVENIGPYESKELSAPFKTKLKVYELPDWQNATPEIQITSPQQ